ncbi:MAG TPA: thiamine pyrophosphate-dependent enzyme, partial [Bryobacterales bacterium]|nr:thiamine pyrophosphate-dependent enzyme [Bryobacterales bacterium]
MSQADIPEAFLRWGYLQANLDPLGRLQPQPHSELELAGEAAERGRAVYCGSIGVEFQHIPYPDRCRWVRERMESAPAEPDRRRILERLIRADMFERVLQTRYLGTKRYSLEGATALIPLLDEILNSAAERGAEQIVLGMSHRGRLNVMAHIACKQPADIFGRFEDFSPRSVLGGGDVKYHVGATGEYATPQGRLLRVHLVSNPSHLEAVDPVVLGRTRAKQDRIGDGGAARVLPITLHGDAAFAGQGIVAETLNMAGLRGFAVGGSLHVIVNNLIGFTTVPRDLHSSRYSSDLAKRLPIPIFHVNGENLDAVARVARLALEYRYAFTSDVVVDLIGYRLHGHSEVDDPTTTQPVLYEKIKHHPPVWQTYARSVGMESAEAEALAEQIKLELEQAQDQAKAAKKVASLRRLPDYWSGFDGGAYDPAFEVDTALAPARLAEIAARITATPGDFHVHPKIERMLDQRREMARGRRPVDWGMAETLAFGGLLWDGVRIRMSGQDTRRGTFNQRHAVLLDVEDEQEYVALRHLHRGQGVFDCCDSPLSEAAPLGFEFGYSRDYPEALVLWEAQFGDFANGAQVII